jgi:hypothetical protein
VFLYRTVLLIPVCIRIPRTRVLNLLPQNLFFLNISVCGWNLHFSPLLVYVSDTCCAHTAGLVFVVSPAPLSLQIMIAHNAISLIVSCVPMFCTCLPPPQFCVSTMYSIMQCEWTLLCHRLPVSLLCLSLTTFNVLIAFQMFWSYAIPIPNFLFPIQINQPIRCNNFSEHEQQHGYHHDTKVKPEAATPVELLMMGVRTPETCWAVNKRQNNKLEKLLCIVGWFVWIVWWCTYLQTLNFLFLFYSSHPVALPSCTSHPHSQPIYEYLAYFPQSSGSSRQSEFLYFHVTGNALCRNCFSVHIKCLSTRKRY